MKLFLTAAILLATMAGCGDTPKQVPQVVPIPDTPVVVNTHPPVIHEWNRWAKKKKSIDSLMAISDRYSKKAERNAGNYRYAIRMMDSSTHYSHKALDRLLDKP